MNATLVLAAPSLDSTSTLILGLLGSIIGAIVACLFVYWVIVREWGKLIMGTIGAAIAAFVIFRNDQAMTVLTDFAEMIF